MTTGPPGDEMDEKKIESFDDLFEPFGLDEEPEQPAAAPPTSQPQAETVVCPSCGTHNPGSNRHCEACGARLETGPLPVAPPPLIRATPGARALGVLAAVVLVVALFAFVWSVVRDDGAAGDVAQNGDNGTTETSVTSPIQIEELLPSVVSASSQYDNFPADNLIDGDSATYWNDKGLRGRDAEITFRFFQPVQIVEIDLVNIADAERFTRNYRIKGYQIVSDDLQVPISGTLEDVADPAPIRIASLETTELTLRVTSTHPATSYEGQPPFNELAVAEIQFFGSSG
ncbi:MAG: hypothetical protein HKO87_07040 [Acidimicrobiia bacterium]|nr:hypothetical protein [Acidimicrobiia bacterium]